MRSMKRSAYRGWRRAVALIGIALSIGGLIFLPPHTGSWYGYFPLVFLVICGWFFMLMEWRDARMLRDRKRRGACPQCGYDLRAGTDGCPECGTPLKSTSV